MGTCPPAEARCATGSPSAAGMETLLSNYVTGVVRTGSGAVSKQASEESENTAPPQVSPPTRGREARLDWGAVSAGSLAQLFSEQQR